MECAPLPSLPETHRVLSARNASAEPPIRPRQRLHSPPQGLHIVPAANIRPPPPAAPVLISGPTSGALPLPGLDLDRLRGASSS